MASASTDSLVLPSRVVRDRMEVIGPLARGKRVLDLGVIDSRRARTDTADKVAEPTSLFKQIAAEAASVVGLDIDEEGCELMRQQGFDVRYGDVHTVDLGETFDTIIAGEIIEHLESPGQFLRNMRRHLKPGGSIFISTPNPFNAIQSYKIWRTGRPRVHEEHTGWFDPITLNRLLAMTGYRTTEAYWHQPHSALLKSWKRLFRPYFSYAFAMVATPNGGD